MDLIMVDCENVAYDIIEKAFINTINAKIYFIVGNLQHKEKYLSIVTRSEIECVECKVTAPNAADFVLVTVLSQQMATGKYHRAIVLSNDRGYDAAITYMREQGILIKREPPSCYRVPDGLIMACAYITKHVKSGLSYTSFEKECAEIFYDKTSSYISYLRQMGLLKIRKLKTDQVFFSVKEMRQALEDKSSARIVAKPVSENKPSENKKGDI